MICSRCNEAFDPSEHQAGYYNTGLCQNCEWDLQWIVEERELNDDE